MRLPIALPIVVGVYVGSALLSLVAYPFALGVCVWTVWADGKEGRV